MRTAVLKTNIHVLLHNIVLYYGAVPHHCELMNCSSRLMIPSSPPTSVSSRIIVLCNVSCVFVLTLSAEIDCIPCSLLILLSGCGEQKECIQPDSH